MSQPPYKPNKSVPLPPLIGSTDGREEELGEMDVTPEESEDDMDPLKESAIGGWRQSTLTHSKSEEEVAEMHALDSDLDRLHDPHLVKSYMRLENSPFLHFKQQPPGGKDKWHEWVMMQKDWMNNVEENPDDYFDDNL